MAEEFSRARWEELKGILARKIESVEKEINELEHRLHAKNVEFKQLKRELTILGQFER